MLFSKLFPVAPLLLALSSASPVTRAALPPVFLLVGDSTTHTGSGWGDGFLSGTVKSPAFGFNYGVSGASLPSYRSSGEWATILSLVAKYKATNEVIVTIQFGHNDQKSASAEAAFSANLKQFVVDVKNAGGVPIIVTPLTRRTFSGGKVVENLSVETAKGLAVAAATSTRVIDLNKASTAYVNAIGAANAKLYNLSASDYTHLNAHGSIVFGRIVSDLLVAKYSDIAAYTVADATLTATINAGKYA